MWMSRLAHSGERLGAPEPAPEGIERPRAAERPRAGDLEALVFRRSLDRRAIPRAGVGIAGDRARQAAQAVRVEAILATEVQQDLGAGHPAGAAVVGELQVADDGTVLASALGRA